ncbi:Ldh family oxidoreductase [Roseomonas elaeocarpi]|uniref:Ldh family oxidoreductase n=1 Tax=Roseomonas elaeocarpi TaxID=907779 RepID=A0ABV6JYN9_9PROT
MNAAAETTERHPPEALRDFAARIFAAAGMEAPKAAAMAEVLVEADLLGHTTHGLALLGRYLDEIAAGHMATGGMPEVLQDRGACVSWDGKRLPGMWLATEAISLALERVGTYGTVSIAIGNAHHLGCLAAYLPRVTERGCLLSIASSAPGVATVAPFGGRQGALSPAPVAFGFPTGGDPVLIDISASVTTNNMAARLVREGRRYPHPWLLDAEGRPSDDPAVMGAGGTILPAGGLDHGQKGYGWALIAEALSQGLSGHGRAEGPSSMTNAAFIQVIDPSAFAGAAAFTREADAITANCRRSSPRPGFEAVRLPGESGLRHRAAGREGLRLYAGVLADLRARAASLGVPVPAVLQPPGEAG